MWTAEAEVCREVGSYLVGAELHVPSSRSASFNSEGEPLRCARAIKSSSIHIKPCSSGGDGSNPVEIRQRFWRSNIVFEILLTRLADADRTRLAGCLYDSEGVNHDVLVVDVRKPRREIERDKRRIHPECAKRMLSDLNEVEMTGIVIDAAAGPTH
jgi:hypothetical protein